MTLHDFRNDFYARYRSTHVVHRKGEASLAAFRQSFPNFQKKYQKILPLDRNANIIELGCGDARFIYWLNKNGYRNVSGSDVSSEQIKKANELGIHNVFESDLFEVLEKNNASIDVLLLRDVLEHFDRSEALKILKMCFRSLKPGGRLILHLPNAESPFFGRIRYGDFTHEMAYTCNSLSQVFNVLSFTNHQFFSDESAAATLRGVPRYLCWKAIETAYKCLLASEVGFGARIVTQNLIAAADRPSE